MSFWKQIEDVEIPEDWTLRVEMPDGTLWEVPVAVIAVDRARRYLEEFDDDLARSLKEDTLPLFREAEYEIIDWATGNMNWEDIEPHAQKVQDPDVDYQRGWIRGSKTVHKPGDS